MKDLTLFSTFDENTYLENVSGLTVSEYIIEKASKAVNDEKTSWIIDTVTGESHGFSEFEQATRRIGSSLYKRGMRKGDTVIYITYDMFNVHLFMCGVWRANGIVRASYPEDDEGTLLERVEESRAGWILCDPETSKMCLSVAASVYWDVEVIVVGEAAGCTSLQNLFEDDGSELPPVKVAPEDTALILCTSGTTGKSKGAEHSHTGLLNQFEIMKYMPLSDKPNLIISKATHITGVLVPLAGLCRGKTCLTMSKISSENLFKAVDSYKPGFVWGFPTFLLSLVNDPEASNYDFSSLEVIASGGAPVTPAIENALMRLPSVKVVFNCYGLTEVCPISWEADFDSSEPAKFQDSPEYSVGKISPGIALQIRDLETREPLGPNEKGEICVKSQGVFKSYYNKPEATQEAFIDGFFLTGDIGYYDENGFLYLVDRMKEIFKYFNNHISPTELEDVIGKHPAVAEVCVVGIPDPDGGGHIPRAFVTVKTDVDQENNLAGEIQEFANEQLPTYKQLKGGVYIVPDLPRGKTGKVTRRLVAELLVPNEA